ncbi:RICIN domain-containing protein [Pseudomonas brassicacearum]|uniref:RICIN domain-containing protein n=1 Tax=Pseudomonas brassicacearum TaxID=930166 RepID=UPI001D34E64F|nr:RICIN domain-containing protein [Pseudomonas brassicacearum]CAH0255165.1 hypothetical protein SRABI06_03244 [Pseudomonas brassicacearum]
MNNENEPKATNITGTEPLEPNTNTSFEERTNVAAITNGRYKIFTYLKDSMLVDMSKTAGARNAHNVKLHTDNPAPESTWNIYNIRFSQRGPLLLITNVLNNNALGMSPYWEDKSGDTKNVVASPVDWRSSQFWVLQDAGDGYFFLINAQTQEDALDVTGSNTTNGTNIVAYPKQNSNNQKFKFSRL